MAKISCRIAKLMNPFVGLCAQSRNLLGIPTGTNVYHMVLPTEAVGV